jgi:hydrogenase-4 component F
MDALSIYFILLVNLVAFVASWYTGTYLDFDVRHNPHHDALFFHVLFNLFHFTMLAVPMLDNLILLWIAVELTTVVSALLVRYPRSRLALEASWKFIMITTTGIIFALLGTLFLAAAIPSNSLKQIQPSELQVDPMRWSVLAHQPVAEGLNQNLVILSFVFVLIGYGTKAGLAPMHTWLPDGHGEAPSPVSALLSGVMLKSALYAILRFYTITNLNKSANASLTNGILLGAGLLSLALATPFIVKGNRFKRVLAYHSLEHMGIITFGIGIGSSLALFGALLHALNHALTKALMFLVFGYIQSAYQDRGQAPGYNLQNKDQDAIQGVLKSMPISGSILAFGGLALVGSPPFNIFMSEFIILWAAIEKAKEESNWVIGVAVIIFLITVTIIFGGLVRHISRLLLGKPPFPPFESGGRSVVRLSAFLFLMFLIVLFGIYVPVVPVDLPGLLEQSVHILESGVDP